MSNFFENAPVYRISKPIAPPRGLAESPLQVKDTELQEIKSLMQSTFYLVESLRTEVTLLRYENKSLKDSLRDYVALINEENKELRRENREMSMRIERNNNEILQKVEQKIKTSNKKSKNDSEAKKKPTKSILKPPINEDCEHNMLIINREKDFQLVDLCFKDSTKTRKEETNKGTKEDPVVIDDDDSFHFEEHRAECIAPKKEENMLVFRTRTGSCYHRDGCRYLRRSCAGILLSEAKKNLYACSRCCPP